MAPCINVVTGSYFTNLKTTWKETLKLANKTHCGAKYKMVEQTLHIYISSKLGNVASVQKYNVQIYPTQQMRLIEVM